jgi:hypothetical protein
MTKDSAKEFLPLVQALAGGKTIQVRVVNTWVDGDDFDFGLEPECYRIKPEPREFWLNTYPSGEIHIHPTKYAADDLARLIRVDCIHVREVL